MLTLLNPLLYSKTGVYRGIHYLFLLNNRDCVTPPRGSSNEYPQSVLGRNMKNIRIFIWKLSIFGGEIFIIFEKASVL